MGDGLGIDGVILIWMLASSIIHFLIAIPNIIVISINRGMVLLNNMVLINNI